MSTLVNDMMHGVTVREFAYQKFDCSAPGLSCQGQPAVFRVYNMTLVQILWCSWENTNENYSQQVSHAYNFTLLPNIKITQRRGTAHRKVPCHLGIMPYKCSPNYVNHTLIASRTSVPRLNRLPISLVRSLHTQLPINKLTLKANPLSKDQHLALLVHVCLLLLSTLILKLIHMLTYSQVNQTSMSYIQVSFNRTHMPKWATHWSEIHT